MNGKERRPHLDRTTLGIRLVRFPMGHEPAYATVMFQGIVHLSKRLAKYNILAPESQLRHGSTHLPENRRDLFRPNVVGRWRGMEVVRLHQFLLQRVVFSEDTLPFAFDILQGETVFYLKRSSSVTSDCKACRAKDSATPLGVTMVR